MSGFSWQCGLNFKYFKLNVIKYSLPLSMDYLKSSGRQTILVELRAYVLREDQQGTEPNHHRAKPANWPLNLQAVFLLHLVTSRCFYLSAVHLRAHRDKTLSFFLKVKRGLIIFGLESR